MKCFLDKNYVIVGDTIINYSGKNLLLKIPEKFGNIRIHSIGEGAFADLPELQYVKIPAEVTSIGARAFIKNPNLISVVLPGTIRNVEKDAFDSCPKLSEFMIYDYLIDEKDYNRLKNNSIRATDGIYVARKIPEYDVIKDIILACKYLDDACTVPERVNRLFYTNERIKISEHQLMNQNVNNICFINQNTKPITENQGVMECIKYSNDDLGVIKADEFNDACLRTNKYLPYRKAVVFTFNDKKTKDVNGKKSISITIRIGYFFFQSVCNVICNGKQYYVYCKYYLCNDSKAEYVRRDVAVYTDKGVVLNKKEAQKVYAKYKFLCIL